MSQHSCKLTLGLMSTGAADLWKKWLVICVIAVGSSQLTAEGTLCSTTTGSKGLLHMNAGNARSGNAGRVSSM
eukprot:3164411-Pyramimonas_sp.AAC.1